MSEEEVRPTALLGVLLSLGGYASLASLLGYVYAWAYLDVFGASFLLAELPPIEALFGTAATVAPFVVGLIAVLIERKYAPRERWVKAFLYAALAINVICATVQVTMGYRLAIGTRVAFAQTAAITALLIAGACALLVFRAWTERRSLWARLAAFILAAFLWWPILAGSGEAMWRVADPERRLPVVTVAEGKLYLLFSTSGRLYCIEPSPSLMPGSVRPIDWSQVGSISSTSEAGFHR